MQSIKQTSMMVKKKKKSLLMTDIAQKSYVLRLMKTTCLLNGIFNFSIRFPQKLVPIIFPILIVTNIFYWNEFHSWTIRLGSLLQGGAIAEGLSITFYFSMMYGTMSYR